MYDAVMEFMRNVKTVDPLKRLTALTATATGLGANCYLPNGPITRLYPNLFTIVMAHPGQGKSLVSNTTYMLARTYNKRYEDMPEMAITIAPKKFNPASFVEFLVTHGIKEIAGEPTCPVFVSSSELSVLVGNTTHGNLLEDFLDMYDCPPTFTKYTRQNGLEEIPRICPTFLAATTPSFWKRFMPSNLANDGFSSRALIYYYDEFIERDGDIQWGGQKEIDQCILELARLKNLCGVFEWDRKGHEWYLEEFTKKNNELMRKHFRGSDLWQGYTNRRSDQMKKIAMCLSASRGNTLKITEEDGKRAVSHLKMVEESLDRLITPQNMKADADSREILIDGLNSRPMTEKDMLQYFSAHKVFITLRELQSLLITLTAEGVVSLEGSSYHLRRK